MHTVQASVHEIGEIQRAALLQIAGIGGLNRRWDQVDGQISTRQGRVRYDINMRRLRFER
jgi:hypothetical protein